MTSQTIDLNVHVGASAANSAPQNAASVSSTTPDPNPSGATSATATVGVGSVANLSLSKSVSPQTANVGDTVTYTLTATNDIAIGEAGGAPARLGTTGGVVTDTLPPGLQFVSSSQQRLHGGGPDGDMSPGSNRTGADRDGDVHGDGDLGRGGNERHESGDDRHRSDTP